MAAVGCGIGGSAVLPQSGSQARVLATITVTWGLPGCPNAVLIAPCISNALSTWHPSKQAKLAPPSFLFTFPFHITIYLSTMRPPIAVLWAALLLIVGCSALHGT